MRNVLRNHSTHVGVFAGFAALTAAPSLMHGVICRLQAETQQKEQILSTYSGHLDHLVGVYSPQGAHGAAGSTATPAKQIEELVRLLALFGAVCVGRATVCWGLAKPTHHTPSENIHGFVALYFAFSGRCANESANTGVRAP